MKILEFIQSISVNSRTISAILMLISGVTHVVQLPIYGAHFHVVGAALFGIAYFLIGLRLLKPGFKILWVGAILPMIGGVLGTLRFIGLQANPFTVFHVIVDLIVVPICIQQLRQRKNESLL